MQLSTILLTAVNAIAPIVLMIALGYFLRQKEMLGEGFLKNGNKLVFKLCLPSMLFVNVYNVPSLADIHWDVVLYGSVALCVIFLLGIGIAVITTPESKRRGVVLQCSFRSNFAIIGLPLAAALGGAEAEAVAAVMSSVTVPLINILAVISLSLFVQEGGKVSVKHILLDIVKNPLIQGVALGMLCLVLRWVQTAIWGGSGVCAEQTDQIPLYCTYLAQEHHNTPGTFGAGRPICILCGEGTEKGDPYFYPVPSASGPGHWHHRRIFYEFTGMGVLRYCRIPGAGGTVCIPGGGVQCHYGN